MRVAMRDFDVKDVKDVAAAADVITNIGAVAEIIQSMITTSPDLAWCVDANIMLMKANLAKVVEETNKRIDSEIRTYTNF